MHITIVTLGSRGDIQPYIPLALGLQRAGYDVRFATFNAFREFVIAQGLDFAPIHGDPRSTMTSQAGQAWLRSGRNFVTATREIRRTFMGEDLMPAFNDALEACRGSDAIVSPRNSSSQASSPCCSPSPAPARHPLWFRRRSRWVAVTTYLLTKWGNF